MKKLTGTTDDFSDEFLTSTENMELFEKAAKGDKEAIESLQKAAGKEKLKVELNSKTQIGKVKNGIDFLGFRLILTETGKVIKKLRGSSKRRIKRHLKNLKKLEDKGIVDREYVNIRKNCFYSRIENSDESRTFLNKARPDY